MLKLGIGLAVVGLFFLGIFIVAQPFIPNAYNYHISIEEKLRMPYVSSYGQYLLLGLVMIGSGALLIVDNYKWKYMKTG